MRKNLYINQIFKGIAPSQYFGEEGTYNSSTAIDPDLPIVSTDVKTSGFPVPVGSATFSSTEVLNPIISIETNPKDNLIWTLQNNVGISSNGNVYAYKKDLSGDSDRVGDDTFGTYMKYYNNYMYLFGPTTIDRLGPLNTLPYDNQTVGFSTDVTVTGATSGATALIVSDVDAGTTGTLTLTNINGFFQDNEIITAIGGGSATVNRSQAVWLESGVWAGATLGSQTALTNTKYPTLRGVDIPNHFAYVHSDGSMYFCDFKDGQGLIHRINTKKVTNEGDTNGTTVPSAYNALDLPFGFYPTCIEGYGTDLIIAGIYSTDTTTNQGSSAFVIWDPTDTSTFHTGPIPLADPLVTAMKNVNGSVYIWTGNAQNGVRLSLYNGGVSVRELVYQEEGLPPFAGAVDALGNRVVWGGHSTYPSTAGVAYGYGSKRADLPVGLHSITRANASLTSLSDSYSESNYSGVSYSITMDGTSSTSRSKGQSFTGTAGDLKTAKFYLKNSLGTATGTLVAKLYAHSGTFGTSSIPTGSALATSNSVDVASISSGFGLVSFDFDTPYTTVAATKYVITVEIQDLGTGTIGVGTDSTSPTHGGNRSYIGSNDIWYASASTDLCFYVYVESENNVNVTALKYVQQDSNISPKLVTAWNTTDEQGIDKYSTTATLDSKIRWMFNIGTKFQIERVSIPLAGAVQSGTIITPTIYLDDLSSNFSLSVINNTNYSGKRKVTYKGSEVKNLVGYNNFILELAYTGTDPLPAALPIVITIDIKDDEE